MDIPLSQKEDQREISSLNMKGTTQEEAYLSTTISIQFLNSFTHHNIEQSLYFPSKVNKIFSNTENDSLPEINSFTAGNWLHNYVSCGKEAFLCRF